MEVAISGSIVLYKTDRSVGQTISSFLNSPLQVKLFLIDNSPTNRLQNELKDLLKDDRVEYIFNNKNIGFGAAHNIAIQKAKSLSKYHLVLNPDVSFDGGVLEVIYNYMEKSSDVGLLMPKVVYPSGNIQYLCKLLPAPFDLLFRLFVPLKLNAKRLRKYEMRFTGYDKRMEVPYLSGCFMFLRTSLFDRVGLFDEQFFLYLEDTDLSRRFHEHGKNMYFPDVTITHQHARGSYKNPKLFYIHSVSAIKYFNKWGWWTDKRKEEINQKALQSYDNGKSGSVD